MDNINEKFLLMDIVTRIWEQYPDLRFWQLIEMVSCAVEEDYCDKFYMPASEWIKKLNYIYGDEIYDKI